LQKSLGSIDFNQVKAQNSKSLTRGGALDHSGL